MLIYYISSTYTYYHLEFQHFYKTFTLISILKGGSTKTPPYGANFTTTYKLSLNL